MRHAASNPFRTSRLESLSWLPAPESLRSFYHRWMQNNWRGQVVGHHGAGKTTLCLQLLALAETNGMSVRSLFANRQSPPAALTPWRHIAAHPSPEVVVLMDGILHVPRRIQKRLLRNTPRLLVTCHHPMAEIPILARLQSTLPLLRTLTRDLAGDEGLSLLGTDGGTALLNHCDGNLRDVFRHLYHLWLADTSGDTQPGET